MPPWYKKILCPHPDQPSMVQQPPATRRLKDVFCFSLSLNNNSRAGARKRNKIPPWFSTRSCTYCVSVSYLGMSYKRGDNTHPIPINLSGVHRLHCCLKLCGPPCVPCCSPAPEETSQHGSSLPISPPAVDVWFHVCGEGVSRGNTARYSGPL